MNSRTKKTNPLHPAVWLPLLINYNRFSKAWLTWKLPRFAAQPISARLNSTSPRFKRSSMRSQAVYVQPEDLFWNRKLCQFYFIFELSIDWVDATWNKAYCSKSLVKKLKLEVYFIFLLLLLLRRFRFTPCERDSKKIIQRNMAFLEIQLIKSVAVILSQTWSCLFFPSNKVSSLEWKARRKKNRFLKAKINLNNKHVSWVSWRWLRKK